MKPYSWDDFTARFKNLSGEIAVYDFSRLEHEHTEPIKKIHTTYNTLFNGDTSKVSYMLKISNKSDSKLMQYVDPIAKEFDDVSEVILRIQANPWRYSSHFDTYHQTVIMLEGSKNWIFFDPKFDGIEHERDFIKAVNGMSFSKLKEYLASCGISYLLKTTHSGDRFLIPMGLYHAVENINDGKGTIFMNIVHVEVNLELEERFSQIWPIVSGQRKQGLYY